MSPREQMARMGEYAVSREAHSVLVSLGLGSCIGLALVDRRSRIAGLAHVVLPAGTPAAGDPPVKYAPIAVPFLIEQVLSLGARRTRLEAVVVGGASMFGATSSLEVGQRNEQAVVELLDAARIPVVARATGGNRGRTIRVYVGDGRVTARVAGSGDEELLTAVPVGALA